MKSDYLLRNFLARNGSQWLPRIIRPLRMKKFLAFALPLFCTASVFAADVAYTKPVGGFKSTAAANTDTRISPVLARDAAWVGTIASTTANTLTAAGSPNWTAGAFAPGASTYYARVLSGALKGQYFIITSSSANALTVDNAGLNLAGISAGDSFEIAAFWTLGTLFPASQAGAAFATTTSPFAVQSQVLTFDASQTGINRAANATYFFYNGAWRKVGASSSISFDSVLVYPDSYVILRNKAAATSLTQIGRVQPGYLGTVIEAVQTTQNDNFVAVSYPVDVTLDGLDLITSGFTPTTSPFAVKDQLLWFDPAGTGYNRAASATFFYYNGGWRKVGASTSTNFGSTVLQAGGGFVIRKAANGATATWTFNTGI